MDIYRPRPGQDVDSLLEDLAPASDSVLKEEMQFWGLGGFGFRGLGFRVWGFGV